MLKKFLIPLIIFTACSSVHAAAPYVGMNAGYSHNAYALLNPFGSTTTFNTRGVIGGAFVGYGGALGQWVYLGTETFLTLGTLITTKKPAGTGTSNAISSNYSFGLDLHPGFNLNPNTRIYGKFGIIKTRFKQTLTPVTPPALSSDVSTVSGTRLGAGLQTTLLKKVDVRFEYVHINYRSFASLGNRIRPRVDQLMVGLAYNFL
jgi:opacity protein-like surface antigen